jgi:hypothetical protein
MEHIQIKKQSLVLILVSLILTICLNYENVYSQFTNIEGTTNSQEKRINIPTSELKLGDVLIDNSNDYTAVEFTLSLNPDFATQLNSTKKFNESYKVGVSLDDDYVSEFDISDMTLGDSSSFRYFFKSNNLDLTDEQLKKVSSLNNNNFIYLKILIEDDEGQLIQVYECFGTKKT